jgi:RimJ/RimL family protein N-acetyltransferase
MEAEGVGSMDLHFCPLDEAAARAILVWRYADAYAVYNSDPAEVEQDLRLLLEPANAYYSVCTAAGQMIAYRCFGPEAQVLGGDYAALALDTGGGLRPDLTGQGYGLGVLEAGLEFGRKAFKPAAFRVTVAAWNERALKVCTRAGFTQTDYFATARGDRFCILLRPE